MADSNWIKLNRGIWSNFLWDFSKPKYALAWIDMLLMANYKDKKILFDGKVEVIKRGSFITSMVKLAERWEMNRKTVKAFLDTLQDDGMIRYESNNRRTTVFISNYEVFQGFDSNEECSDGQQTDNLPDNLPDSNGTTHWTQHKNIKEGEEGKEGKNDITVSKDTVCQTDVRQVIEQWNSLSAFGIKAIVKLSTGTKRYDSLVARLNQYGKDAMLKAIDKIRQSDFLKGKNKDGWTITFDWFVKPNNFPKVLEGNYDNKQGRTEPIPSWFKKGSNFNSFEQHDYDFEKLEDEISNVGWKEEAEALKKELQEKY